VKAIILLSLFISSWSLFAQGKNSDPTQVTSQTPVQVQSIQERSFNKKLFFGVEAVNWDYKEIVANNKIFMKDSGNLYGIKIRYQNYFESIHFLLRTHMRYLYGATNYSGSYNDGTPVKLKTSNSIFETRVTGGFSFAPNAKFSITPYSGLSYRILTNPDSGTPGDYSRQITYTMLPIGAHTNIALNNKQSLEFGVEYSYLIEGTVNTYIFGGVRNKQKKGFGWEANASFYHDFESFTFGVGPYYRIWDFEDSETVYRETSRGIYSFKEPKNLTKQMGINFSVLF